MRRAVPAVYTEGVLCAEQCRHANRGIYPAVRDLSEPGSVKTYPAMLLLQHPLPRRS